MDGLLPDAQPGLSAGGLGLSTAQVRVGVSVSAAVLDAPAGSRALDRLSGVEYREVDFLSVADHVSFRDGLGIDGLLHAAALLAHQPRLPVQVSVYLLALRHPVVVARQIADIERLTPGRLTLAIGVGGEDRDEFAVCGVNPATRGRRTDESLAILRPLLHGTPTSSRGEFFDVGEAVIQPAVPVEVPILVGGRSDAALARVARAGDGWQAMWVSPQRFVAATAQVDSMATQRDVSRWQHGLTVWCAVDPVRQRAVDRMTSLVEQRYGMPYERIARWSPAGPADEVAEFLAGYVEAGCRSFTLVVAADAIEASLEAAEEVRQALLGHV